MSVRRIIVACGSGVATSNMVAEKLRGILRERGLRHVEVRAVDVKSLSSEAQNADLLLSIAPYSRINSALAIPVLSGIPLLTGVGVAGVVDRIIALVGGRDPQTGG